MAVEMTHVDLLRHGACEGGEIYRGSSDVALTAEGWQQMADAVSPLEGWQRLVSSPLTRCRGFATELAEHRNLPLTVEPGFRELCFGEWEGRSIRDVWKRDRERADAFYANPLSVTPPGGESIAAVSERVAAAWQGLLRDCRGEKVLLICHGGVIRLLLCHLLDIPVSAMMRLDVPYASLSRLRVYHSEEGDSPVLLSHNCGANGA